MTKTRKVAPGISISVPDDDTDATSVDSVKANSETRESSFLIGNEEGIDLVRNTSIRRFCQLTKEEERGIEEDLRHVKSAIKLYYDFPEHSFDNLDDSEVVCLLAELEQAREAGSF